MDMLNCLRCLWQWELYNNFCQGMYDIPSWDTFDIKIVMIQFHIVHPQDWDPVTNPIECTPPTTEEDILGMDGMLVKLNRAFAPANIQFVSIGVNEFADGDLHRITCYADYKQLLETYDTPNAIDVYFVDQILADICNCLVLPADVCAGAGGVSNSTASDLRGVVIRHCGNKLINPCDCPGLPGPAGCEPCPENCGIETPAVFIHEMGHYFDLLHPNATEWGTECPGIELANCSTCGDFLCGTQAEPAGSYDVENCVATNLPAPPQECVVQEYQPPDLTNFMSNKGDAALCRNHFTRGQLARARATLLNLLADELL